MRIYVATSWKNSYQPDLKPALRDFDDARR
jgi:hypothetical protein